MADASRTSLDVTTDMVWEAIRSLKPKSKQVRPDTRAPARHHFFRAVIVVPRKDVVTYLIKRYNFDVVAAIFGVERLVSNNEFTMWIGKDEERYIDAGIGEQG